MRLWLSLYRLHPDGLTPEDLQKIKDDATGRYVSVLWSRLSLVLLNAETMDPWKDDLEQNQETVWSLRALIKITRENDFLKKFPSFQRDYAVVYFLGYMLPWSDFKDTEAIEDFFLETLERLLKNKNFEEKNEFFFAKKFGESPGGLPKNKKILVNFRRK